jgi:hypothetical protein
MEFSFVGIQRCCEGAIGSNHSFGGSSRESDTQPPIPTFADGVTGTGVPEMLDLNGGLPGCDALASFPSAEEGSVPTAVVGGQKALYGTLQNFCRYREAQILKCLPSNTMQIVDHQRNPTAGGLRVGRTNEVHFQSDTT